MTTVNPTKFWRREGEGHHRLLQDVRLAGGEGEVLGDADDKPPHSRARRAVRPPGGGSEDGWGVSAFGKRYDMISLNCVFGDSPRVFATVGLNLTCCVFAGFGGCSQYRSVCHNFQQIAIGAIQRQIFDKNASNTCSNDMYEKKRCVRCVHGGRGKLTNSINSRL